MKGRFFETLVMFLEQSFKDNPNTTIRQNAKLKDQGGIEREFDIVIDSALNGYPIRIVIECKDYKRKVEMAEIEAFKTKSDSVPSIHRRVIVSKSGFQSNAIEIANRYGISLHTLAELESADVEKWVQDSGFVHLSCQTTITNFGFGYVSNVKPEVGEGAVFQFESEDDGGIPTQVIPSIIYQSRAREIQELAFGAHSDAVSQGYNPTSVTFQLLQDFSGSGLYVIEANQKQYISQVRLSFRCDFTSIFLTPDFSGSYHDIGLNSRKGRIFVYKAAMGNGQEITVVKQEDNPNHTHIYISGPNGAPLPLEDAPRMFLPEGIEVEATHPEIADLLIRKGGMFKFEPDKLE